MKEMVRLGITLLSSAPTTTKIFKFLICVRDINKWVKFVAITSL